MAGLEKFPEGRRQKAAIAVPSWATGRILPISSYVDVSAGWSRSVHASARPELVSLPAQPYQRAPPNNSDRNRNSGPAGSGEVVAPLWAKIGGNSGGLSSGVQPTFTNQVQTPLRQGSSVGVGKEEPLAQKDASAWSIGRDCVKAPNPVGGSERTRRWQLSTERVS